MASLCLDLLTSCWQEEAETEFTSKTLDLEALFGLKCTFRRSAAALAAADGCRWQPEAHLEVDGKRLGV